MSQYFSIIETECDYAQWFKLSKELFHLEEDVLFGVVYVPPETSKYFIQEKLDAFYSEISSFSCGNKYTILLGDFNARSSNIPDVADMDKTIFDSIDVDISSIFCTGIHEYLCRNDMSLVRNSQDNVVNRLGRLLANFCRLSDFVILNGRSFSDKIGHLTCKDTSVIDYVISSCESLPLFNGFNVENFCPILSDVHCCLKFKLSSIKVDSNNQFGEPKDKIGKLNTDKMEDFLNNINMSVISELTQKLSNTDIPLDQSSINEIVATLETAITDSAKDTVGVNSSFPKNKCNKKRKLKK